jgi:glycerate-2-kinase
MSTAAIQDGCRALVDPNWIWGPVEDVLDRLFSVQFEGLQVAAGEPVVAVHGNGAGGRNTHASLLAASRIANTPLIFAALATDGSDGNSGAAGAVVDGTTLERGGDPDQALARFDSAGYLQATGDLVITGDTGTNVADLWALWRP